jgi:hypothetical protein
MYPYGQVRSAIPRVIGILSLVFAPIGIFFSLVFVAGPISDHHSVPHDWQPLVTWLWITAAASVLVFAVHLVAGITATMYKPSAPRWMTIYGALGLALVAARFVMPIALTPSMSDHDVLVDDFVFMQVGYAVVAAPWPLVALILMNLRGAKAACRNPAAVDLNRVFT